jgi:hypothetical protein
MSTEEPSVAAPVKKSAVARPPTSAAKVVKKQTQKPAVPAAAAATTPPRARETHFVLTNGHDGHTDTAHASIQDEEKMLHDLMDDVGAAASTDRVSAMDTTTAHQNGVVHEEMAESSSSHNGSNASAQDAIDMTHTTQSSVPQHTESAGSVDPWDAHHQDVLFSRHQVCYILQTTHALLHDVSPHISQLCERLATDARAHFRTFIDRTNVDQWSPNDIMNRLRASNDFMDRVRMTTSHLETWCAMDKSSDFPKKAVEQYLHNMRSHWKYTSVLFNPVTLEFQNDNILYTYFNSVLEIIRGSVSQ